MKYLIGLLIGLFSIFSCQNSQKENTQPSKNSEKLIDGTTIDNTIVQKNDIDLKKYQYNNHYMEETKFTDIFNEGAVIKCKSPRTLDRIIPSFCFVKL